MGKTLEQVMKGFSPEFQEEVEQLAWDLIEDAKICGSELAREGPQSGPKTIPHDLQADELPDSAPD